MSYSFTQKNVAEFLSEQGCSADDSSFISNFVVAAVRSISINGEITEQSVLENGYNVTVRNNGGNKLTIAYTRVKLGSGFYDHRATVRTPENTYSVSRLVHTAQDESNMMAATAPVEPAEETPVAAPVVEETKVEVVTEEIEAAVEEEPKIEEEPKVEVVTEEIKAEAEAPKRKRVSKKTK